MGTFTLQPEPISAAGQVSQTGDSPVDNPLSRTHHRALAAARERAKPIRKAARVAAFNGWTTAAIAGLSAPFALFDHSGAVLTIGLAVVAYNEFRGRKQLLNFDPRAAKLLGWNQLGLLAMIVVYSLWSLYGSFGEAGALSAELKQYSDLDAALGGMNGVEGLVKQVSVAVYSTVIGLSVLFQGGNALYYFSRRRRIAEFFAETPEWVRDVQRGSLSA